MHFFTTHPLKLRMDYVGRKEGKAVLIFTHTLTHKHNALLDNSPPKVENGLGREQGKVGLISIHSYTNTQTQCTSSQLTG